MNLLLSLAAGLVGCFYINRLDKLSESVRGKFRKLAVSLYPLDKLFQIFCLSLRSYGANLAFCRSFMYAR